MEEKFIGTLYAVYDRQVLNTSTNEAEILHVTEDQQIATLFANIYKGVVYVYDVTQAEEYINESFVYDGTEA